MAITDLMTNVQDSTVSDSTYFSLEFYVLF